MHKENLSTRELSEALGVGIAMITRWVKEEGCPRDGTQYNLLQVCEWILANKPRSKCRPLARNYLGLDKQKAAPPKPAEKIEDQKLGLEAALERLRNAEAKAHAKWESAFDVDDPDSGNYFRSWQQSLELLRKAEASLLEVLKERRELLPAGEVKAWLARNIEAAKGRLLEIPPKVAPTVEGMDWTQVQQLLEDEIQEALKNVASAPE
jgi:hypothetical protein